MEGNGSSGTYPLWFEELLLFMLLADDGLQEQGTFKSSVFQGFPNLPARVLWFNLCQRVRIAVSHTRNDRTEE